MGSSKIMNKETQRIILASILITLVAYFYPNFWYVDNSTSNNSTNIDTTVLDNETITKTTSKGDDNDDLYNKNSKIDKHEKKTINIANKLYYTTLSSESGGTFISTQLVEKNNDIYKYSQKNIVSETDDRPIRLGNVNPDLPVVLEGGSCNPCLAIYDSNAQQYEYINSPFKLLGQNMNSEYFLNDDDTLILNFETIWNNIPIQKTITFYGSSYETVHQYSIASATTNRLEVVWDGGMQAVDQADYDWETGNAMIGQSGETESIQISDGERYISREEYNGSTDWVSVRTKYFIAAVLANDTADYAVMSGGVSQDDISSSYTVGLGYYGRKQINTSVYLGPLDIDYIGPLNNSLDDTINFGFAIVRPIGKFVLWFLKLMHNTFSLNYGICLIIFAFIIQLITSPLTKKMYESSRKMQEIQPKVKKIQEKYKNDAQKMNQEVMKIYSENGVNPLGGCLPLLLQMPLLMAIFSVFRDTIEFRGASFIFWINDLSQPDILFHLPFSIPLYGDHVAFLPIIMGISIFLTQRLSMATMDPAQRPMMYIMNGFFILIFNGFPAGLNLYYTVYNLLNYYQQKTIRS